MTFDLGLALNLSGLSLAIRSNHIYPGHMITVIIFFLQIIQKLFQIIETNKLNQIFFITLFFYKTVI